MTQSYKHLFQRSLAANSDRLHFAAHSHHLWPDASWLGHQAAWEDAARLADTKWRRVMEEMWPAGQGHVARELGACGEDSGRARLGERDVAGVRHAAGLPVPREPWAARRFALPLVYPVSASFRSTVNPENPR